MGALKQLWKLGSTNRTIPSFLKHCSFYFDKTLTTVTDTGTMVVTDLSGCGINATQGTSANKPTFSTSVGLTFDNSNDFLTFSEDIQLPASNFTMYLRYNRVSAGDDTILLNLTDTASGIWLMFRSGSIYLALGSSSVSFTSLNNSDITGDKLYRIDCDNTNLHIYSNGTLISTVAKPANFGYKYAVLSSIGSSSTPGYAPPSGVISQFMIFNKYLDVDETSIIESQLTTSTEIETYSTVSIPAILFTGQSNCSGRNILSDYPVQYTGETKGKVLDINIGQLKDVGTVPIDSYDLGYSPLSTIVQLKSFELPTSYSLAKNTMWLKFGVGSSYLATKTSNYNWSWDSTNSFALIVLFKQYYVYFKQKLKSLGYSPTFISVRMQGEQDGVLLADANAFETNLTNWINSLRTYTGLGTDLKHIEFQIYDPAGNYHDTIKTAQANVCNTLSNCILIPTDTFELKVDNVHYSTNGIISGGTALKNYI